MDDASRAQSEKKLAKSSVDCACGAVGAHTRGRVLNLELYMHIAHHCPGTGDRGETRETRLDTYTMIRQYLVCAGKDRGAPKRLFATVG